MSQRILGVLAAACFAIAAPIANADTPCGCGQVVSPMGAVYGGSVVDPYNAGGVVYGGGQIMGGQIMGDQIGGQIIDGSVGQGTIGSVIGSGGCCGSTIQYQTRTVYENQSATEMRTVTRTRYRTETRTQEYTVNVQVPTTQQQSYTVMVQVPVQSEHCLLYTSPSPRDS